MKDTKTYKNRTGLIGNKLAQCNAISQELYGGDFYEVEPWNRIKVIHTFNLRAQNGVIKEVKPFTPTPYQEKARRSLRKGHAIVPVTALEIQVGKNYRFVETMADNEINRRAFCCVGVANGKTLEMRDLTVTWIEDRGDYLYLGYKPAPWIPYGTYGEFGAERIYKPGVKQPPFGVVAIGEIKPGIIGEARP